MNKIKLAIFFLIIAFIMSVPFMFQRYLNNLQKETILKEQITKLIKTTFNKAVRIDQAHFNVFGNIVLDNVLISNYSDFNDNLIFINCRRMEISVDLKRMLKKNIIVIDKIYFDSPEINLIKKFSDSYENNFKQLLELNILKNINIKKGKKITMEISNGSINYREMFKDDALKIYIYSIDGFITLNNKLAETSISGKIDNYLTKKLSSSLFFIDGSILFDNNYHFINVNQKIKLHNIDVSYINPYLEKKFNLRYLADGGISADLVLNAFEDNISLSGKTDFINLKVMTNLTNEPNYLIVKNANISLNFNTDLFHNMERLILRTFSINDENFNIKGKGAFINNNLETKAQLSLSSNDINLGVLSKSFSPVNAVAYKGNLKFNTDIDYDFIKESPDCVKIKMNLNDFTVVNNSDGIKKNIVEAANLKLELNNGQFVLDSSGKSGKSDFSIKIDTFITNWKIFSSNSYVNIYSQNFEFAKICYLYYYFNNWIIDEALIDRMVGYDGVFFLARPYGRFLFNNNIDIKLGANSVLMGDKSKLEDCIFQLKLDKAKLSTEKFSVRGYDAAYSMDLRADFSQNYAIFKADCSVTNFNLTAWNKDSGIDEVITGNLSAGFNYAVNGFRLKHLIFNNTLAVWCELSNGTLSNIGIQKMFNTYLKDSNYSDYSVKTINYTNFGFKYQQNNLNHHIYGLRMYSDCINFSTAGNYYFKDGFNIPFQAELVFKDENIIKKQNIPLLLKGNPYDLKLISRNQAFPFEKSIWE